VEVAAVDLEGPRLRDAERLAELPEWFIDALVTRVVGTGDVARAFENDETTIKTAVEFDTR